MPATRARDISEFVELVKAEYDEMPDLSLTKWQAERLFGLDSISCEAVLDTLVATKYLARTRSGAYRRLHDGPVRRAPHLRAPRWTRRES